MKKFLMSNNQEREKRSELYLTVVQRIAVSQLTENAEGPYSNSLCLLVLMTKHTATKEWLHIK